MSRRGGWINSKTDDLAQISSLVFGDVVEDRLPCLLLLVNEAGGFGGRHRIRIAAERSKLLLQFRVERNCAQVLAYLVDDGFGRADRCHQNTPRKPGIVSATVGMSGNSARRFAEATAISLIEPDRAAPATPE
jgi:hypothetical protein